MGDTSALRLISGHIASVVLLALALVGVGGAQAGSAGLFFSGPGVQLPSGAATAVGSSVAVSADGRTALVGGYLVGVGGTVSVFVRSGSAWKLQERLTPGPPAANESFGIAVALSADGSTALIGGCRCPGGGGVLKSVFSDGLAREHALIGQSSEVWVFVRSGSAWRQQGPVLQAGAGDYGSEFGSSVALSAAGDTALVGGPDDSGGIGSAWVFRRTDGKWRRQAQLAPSDEQSGPTENGGESQSVSSQWPGQFGCSVSLSWNGDVALIGGLSDNGGDGAAWVFNRSGSTWAQQGAKLTGQDAEDFGSAVALSGDGNSALIAADDGVSALSHSGTAWKSRLIRTSGAIALALAANGKTALLTGSVTPGKYAATTYTVRTYRLSARGWEQGRVLSHGLEVALAADGSTALVGGPPEDSGPGSARAFQNTPLSNPPPLQAAPASGRKGTRVTITGADLADAAVVRFGGVEARFTVVSATAIVATVPAGAATGAITVLTPDGTLRSARSFQIR